MRFRLIDHLPGNRQCACGGLADRQSGFQEAAPLVVVPRADDSLASILAHLRREEPGWPMLVVFCDAGRDIQTAALCLNDGREDFLCCPFSEPELEARLARLAALVPAAPVTSGLPSFIVGQSPMFLSAFSRVRTMASTNLTVLLTGETGTGKELFARAIHYSSSRKSGPFIAVNCAGLTETLLENELFGHKKGAYTDASTSEGGVIQAAQGGTLFLDEIDSLSLVAQAKLLRFLQSREFRPLGAQHALTSDARIVAATNADISQAVQARTFRADLMYRLSILTLRLPSLRERQCDIPVLARHFLEKSRSQFTVRAAGFSGAALSKLAGFAWPGNVRQLEAVVLRAAVMSPGPLILPDDLDIRVAANARFTLSAAKKDLVREFERAFLTNVLTVNAGNLSTAARESGVERRAFQRLLRKHSLDRTAFANGNSPSKISSAR